MSGNMHIKETQAAKRFANENDIYGIRFLVRYKDWYVFDLLYPPGMLVDPAWPPVYIIVDNKLSARLSNDEEGLVIHDYLISIKPIYKS